jgi:hypothetical protein
MKHDTYYPPIESFRRVPKLGFWNYALVIVLAAAIAALIFA